jgi:hypothetical protein
MRTFAGTLLILYAAWTSGVASAQEEPVRTGEFSVSRFTPAPGAGNYIMADGAYVSGHLLPSAGIMLDWAYRPFTLFKAVCQDEAESNCEVTESEAHIVRFLEAEGV